MKRTFLKLVVGFAIASFALTSCGGEKAADTATTESTEETTEETTGSHEGHSHEGHSHEAEEVTTEEGAETTAYFCPMKCEGEKTYAETGSCPTCGMALVAVETSTTTEEVTEETTETVEEESHEGHNH